MSDLTRDMVKMSGIALAMIAGWFAVFLLVMPPADAVGGALGLVVGSVLVIGFFWIRARIEEGNW